MYKSLLIVAASALTISFSAGAASAQSTPGADWRQHNQSQRIFDGVQNGSLTFRETGQLIRGQARIHNQERRFRSDGVVTRRERVRMHRTLNRQSRRIYRRKHN
ncbi:MAG: hypothetical protein AAFW74_01250 [Pseudomonadota bacterium]